MGVVLGFLRSLWGRFWNLSLAVKIAIALGLAVLVLLWLLKLERDSSAAARRAQEREARHGLIFAEEATQRDLDTAVRIAGLQDQLAAERQRGDRLQAVLSARTRPAVAGGTPRDGGQSANLDKSQGPGAKPESPTAACPPCLLAAGDEGAAAADIALSRTKTGNLYVEGKVACLRVTPSESVLFSSPLDPVRTKFSADLGPASSPPGWGGGAFGMAGPSGWAAGPMLGLPPLRFLGIQLEIAAGVGYGPAGLTGTGMLLVRP